MRHLLYYRALKEEFLTFLFSNQTPILPELKNAKQSYKISILTKNDQNDENWSKLPKMVQNHSNIHVYFSKNMKKLTVFSKNMKKFTKISKYALKFPYRRVKLCNFHTPEATQFKRQNTLSPVVTGRSRKSFSSARLICAGVLFKKIAMILKDQREPLTPRSSHVRRGRTPKKYASPIIL